MYDNVCIILVTRNRIDFLKNLVSILEIQTSCFEKCIIVDNDSSDGTLEFLECLNRSNFEILISNYNVGHGAALSKGMQHALENYNCNYFILLEDDSIVGSDLINELVYNLKSNPEYDAICAEGRNYKIGKSLIVEADIRVRQVDFGVFDAFILKSELVKKIGYPKDNYFMMCDDLEYCKRITKSGYKIGIVNIKNHKTLHAGSEKFSNSTLWRCYYQSRNRIHVLREYFNLIEFCDCFIWQLKYLFYALLAPDRSKRFFFRILGIWHGINGIMGKSLDPKTLSFKRSNL